MISAMASIALSKLVQIDGQKSRWMGDEAGMCVYINVCVCVCVCGRQGAMAKAQEGQVVGWWSSSELGLME